MIDLPIYPQPSAMTPSEIDFGTILSPPTGGEDQRLNRLGNKHRFQISMPPMPSAKLGRQWLIDLKRAKKEGARMPFPLLGFEPGASGAVVVNGSTAAGSTLLVRGAWSNYVFRNGAPFSIEVGGRHYLHFVAGEVIASDTGTATLTIDPPLRKQPSDADVCHFGTPMIEGFIEGDEFSWQMSVDHFLGFDFSIREAR